MEIWQAIVLGLVQGITEFLPVSSSGHLIVCERWLGVEGGLFFGVMLHVGTLIPLVAVYLKKILELFRPPFRKLGLARARQPPRGARGLSAGGLDRRGVFRRNVCDFRLSADGGPGWRRRSGAPGGQRSAASAGKESAVYGIAQAFAILPGLSRSGTTAATGCFLGVNREDNADFCFLMSVPVICGAALSEGIKAAVGGAASHGCPSSSGCWRRR